MIHYHGTPIGGSRDGVARFLLGRHALIPFPRQDDLGIVADACQSFVFDNGAYTVWKSGGVLDVAGYIAWVREWMHHPAFDWALIPDVIQGSEEENDRHIAEWNSAGLHDVGAPVWHLHEPLGRAARLCDEFRTVALGSSGAYSSPSTRQWWGRIAEAMDVICDAHGRPRAKLHGLRMLDPRVFTRMPLSSADSVNAAMNAGGRGRFGLYVPPTAAQRAAVIAARIEMHNSSPIWIRNATQLELHEAEETDGP